MLEFLQSRYSVRKYSDKPIEDEKTEKILKAAMAAPTARNCQPQKIFVLKSQEARDKLAKVTPCTFNAPVVFVIGYDKTRAAAGKVREGFSFGDTDAAIVGTHMMLEACSLGLGSCWVGWFSEQEVRDALGIEENISVCALLPVGYAADDAVPGPGHTACRDMSEVVEIL